MTSAMFPDARGLARRTGAWLGDLAGQMPFRIGVAVALVCLHLLVFDRAGHERLGIPFNSHPGEEPYYSDPDVQSLGWHPRQPHYWSRLVVSRWDAQHYIGFAIRGISSCPKDGRTAQDWQYMQCGVGWLPAYGLIGGQIADIIHLPPDVTLLLMSCICAVIVSLIWTSRTIVDRIGKPAAWGTLIAFNAYPSAFYLVTPYTEAATFALVLGAYIMMTRQHWVIAGLMIGAATGLRVSAAAFSVGFGIAALIVAWRRRKAKSADWWHPIAGAALAGWGLMATFVWYKIALNEPWAYLRARHAFGDTRQWGRLFSLKFYVNGFTAQHADTVMLLGVYAAIALTFKELLKKFPLEELVYFGVATGLTIVLGVAAVHEYWGLNRYLMACPLAFLGLGLIARRHFGLFVLWLLLCAGMYWHIEMCSYLAHGQPSICPCLGKVEFYLPFDVKP